MHQHKHQRGTDIFICPILPHTWERGSFEPIQAEKVLHLCGWRDWDGERKMMRILIGCVRERGEHCTATGRRKDSVYVHVWIAR